jgi:hypothetical protein
MIRLYIFSNDFCSAKKTGCNSQPARFDLIAPYHSQQPCSLSYQHTRMLSIIFKLAFVSIQLRYNALVDFHRFSFPSTSNSKEFLQTATERTPSSLFKQTRSEKHITIQLESFWACLLPSIFSDINRPGRYIRYLLPWRRPRDQHDINSNPRHKRASTPQNHRTQTPTKPHKLGKYTTTETLQQQ